MSRLRRKLFDYSEPDSLVNRMRRRRYRHFISCLKTCSGHKPLSILDIGGTYSYWKLAGLLDPEQYHITLINLRCSPVPEQIQGFASIEGDVCSDQINLGEYDIIYSNSVIEHLGSYEAMEEIADRICQTGKPYYVQTPSRWFPLEPHCHLPLFQFIPRRVRAWLIWNFRIQYFPRGSTYRECLEVSDSTILLGKKRFMKLFPKADILTEKMLGLPKSYTVFHGFSGVEGVL